MSALCPTMINTDRAGAPTSSSGGCRKTQKPSTTCCPWPSPAREAAWRSAGPAAGFDVQVMGAAALHLARCRDEDR